MGKWKVGTREAVGKRGYILGARGLEGGRFGVFLGGGKLGKGITFEI